MGEEWEEEQRWGWSEGTLEWLWGVCLGTAGVSRDVGLWGKQGKDVWKAVGNEQIPHPFGNWGEVAINICNVLQTRFCVGGAYLLTQHPCPSPLSLKGWVVVGVYVRPHPSLPHSGPQAS